MNPTITVMLTLPNGNTRKVHYEVAGDTDRAAILFATLRDQAWAASVYAHEGDDALSREASHYTPEAR